MELTHVQKVVLVDMLFNPKINLFAFSLTPGYDLTVNWRDEDGNSHHKRVDSWGNLSGELL